MAEEGKRVSKNVRNVREYFNGGKEQQLQLNDNCFFAEMDLIFKGKKGLV